MKRKSFLLGLVLLGLGLFSPFIARADGPDTWYQRHTLSGDNEINNMIYQDNTFVAVGTDITNGKVKILTSTYGETWTERVTGITGRLLHVAFGNGVFVAVGEDGSGNVKILTSPDGETWTERDPGFSGSLNGIAYDNTDGVFAAVGNDGSSVRILTSTDNGENWNIKDTNITGAKTGVLQRIAYGNGVFVAVGGTMIMELSED